MTRGDNLDDLEARAGSTVHVVSLLVPLLIDSLSYSAVEFNFTAKRVKRKMCWKNIKLWFVLLFILIVILAVLISEYWKEYIISIINLILSLSLSLSLQLR